MSTRAADQYTEIASRLKQIEEDKRTTLQVTSSTCVKCDNRGWVYRDYAPVGWNVCTYCGNPNDRSAP